MSTRVPLRLSEAADSLAKASSPEPFSTSKMSNWVARKGGLPPYVQHIAHDIMEKRGKTESEAIQIAIGVVKNPPASWDANAKAAAAKAAGEWEAKKGSSKVKESIALADRVCLRTAAAGRLEAIVEAFGVEGVELLLEAPVASFKPELRRVASAQSEKERLEVHHDGQHVGTLTVRQAYRPAEPDRWAAKSVNGRMIGEMCTSKGAATELLKKHLEDAPGRVSPSPTDGRFLVAEPQGYSGPTSFKEFPSESAARYEAGLPEKPTSPEKAAQVAALGEMVVFDVFTLGALGEELPAGCAPLSEAGFSPFEDAKHPRDFRGRFKVGDRVRIMAGDKKGVLTHTVTKIEGDKATVKTPDNPSLGGGATKTVALSSLRSAPGEAIIAAGRKAEADRTAVLSRMGFGGPHDKPGPPSKDRTPGSLQRYEQPAKRAELHAVLDKLKPGDSMSLGKISKVSIVHEGGRYHVKHGGTSLPFKSSRDAAGHALTLHRRALDAHGKVRESESGGLLGSLLEAEAATSAPAFSKGDRVNYQHPSAGRVKAKVTRVSSRHVYVESSDPRVKPLRLTHQQAGAKLSTTSKASRGSSA